MKYAWGIGFHWYETWTGGDPKYDNLKNIKESYPSINLLLLKVVRKDLIQIIIIDGLMLSDMVTL